MFPLGLCHLPQRRVTGQGPRFLQIIPDENFPHWAIQVGHLDPSSAGVGPEQFVVYPVDRYAPWDRYGKRGTAGFYNIQYFMKFVLEKPLPYERPPVLKVQQLFSRSYIST